jgi:nucleotide-binding universal stress UspA family protein
MKILLAADGSDYTEKAVQYLSTHLNLFQGSPELTLLHVHAPLPGGFAESRARAIAGNAVVDEHYREDAQEALAPASKILDGKNIPFRKEFVVGSDVAEEIRAYAEKNNVDLIVLGSHGHGAVMNVVLGSVATKVIEAVKLPVLVIR